MSAATQGKEHALAKLAERRAANANRKRVDNASLYAGSPMFYYCRTCGAEMTMSEGHLDPAPHYCSECQTLVELGWME